MVRKTLVSFIGIALLVFSIVVFGFNIKEKRLVLFFQACPPDSQCVVPLGFGENYIVSASEMSLRSSQAIVIDTGLYGYVDCPINSNENIRYEAVLSAPGFDVEPSSIQQGYAQEPGHEKWVWVVKPTEVGTYELAFKISAYHGNCEIDSTSQTFKVTVVNLFGLNAFQSNILGVVSGFLGSAFTLPGILVIWENLKKSRMKLTKDIEQAEEITLVVSAKGDEKKINLKK